MIIFFLFNSKEVIKKQFLQKNFKSVPGNIDSFHLDEQKCVIELKEAKTQSTKSSPQPMFISK